MGIVRMGPPEDIVLELKKNTRANCFVETGTYFGTTTLWASKYFDRVFTVEYSKKQYDIVQKLFNEVENINAFFGDTRAFLKEHLKTIPAGSIFWLDAHWCGGDSYGENDQCPLLEELELILSKGNEHIILIDDARLFCSPPPKPNDKNQYPDISTLLLLLHGNNHYVAIVDDVILSIPKIYEENMKDFLQERNTKAWRTRGNEKQGFIKKIKRHLLGT